MINDNKQIAVYIFCIIVVTILSITIYNNGKGMSCEDCKIEFKQTSISGMKLDEPFVKFNICPVELYDELMLGECVIVWDDTQGYVNG